MNNPCRLVLAIALNSCMSAWPTVANLHAVWLRFLELKSPKCHSHALANASKDASWLTVANAHAVLASSFVLKLLIRRSATLVNTMNNGPAD